MNNSTAELFDPIFLMFDSLLTAVRGDCSIISIHWAIRLRVVGCYRIASYIEDVANVLLNLDEELRDIVGYNSAGYTLWKDSIVQKYHGDVR